MGTGEDFAAVGRRLVMTLPAGSWARNKTAVANQDRLYEFWSNIGLPVYQN